MPKRIYQEGEPCDVCGTLTVPGNNGAYCKACYIKWAEANKKTAPVQPQQSAIPPRDFEKEARGKVRHGLVCAMISAGWDDEK